MILTPDNLHHYLLEKGVLDTRSLVDGSYCATQSRTRNVTFNVTRRHGKNLFVKQLTQFDPGNSYILQKDATCLWLIKNEKSFRNLSKSVPDYFGYDAENQVLITEFLADARNLEIFFKMEGRKVEDFTAEIARILSSFHFPLSDELLQLPSMRFFQRQIPWVMNLGVAGSGTQPSTSPVAQMVSGNPDFRAMLRDARAIYEFTSLIHGDIKWMNFLAHGPQGKEQIKLIDWEIADIGDPLWDVGGVLMCMVVGEVADSPYRPKDMSKFPANNPAEALEPCWPIMRKFWNEYAAQRGYDPQHSAALLSKALHFAGARLIQTAIEFNGNGNQINPNSGRILQACIALFAHRDYILSQIVSSQTQTV